MEAKNQREDWEAVQLAQCLACKHRDLSLMPAACERQTDVVVCGYTPGTGEVETGMFVGFIGQPASLGPR